MDSKAKAETAAADDRGNEDVARTDRKARMGVALTDNRINRAAQTGGEAPAEVTRPIRAARNPAPMLAATGEAVGKEADAAPEARPRKAAVTRVSLDAHPAVPRAAAPEAAPIIVRPRNVRRRNSGTSAEAALRTCLPRETLFYLSRF